MNLAQALHTQARRYCQEEAQRHRQQSWHLRTQVQPDIPPKAAKQLLLACYGRAEILELIGIEVERLNFDTLTNLEETRDRILDAAETAKPTPPSPNMGQQPIQYHQSQPNTETIQAIQDERQKFCQSIQELGEAQLQAIQPLPYRKVLSIEESQHRWSQLRQRWQIKGYLWHPLLKSKLTNIKAFTTEAFEDFSETVNLIEILASRDIHRIWELREYGVQYEQDLCLLDPIYNGHEGYWSSQNSDWIIYASHEESITIGGWLLEEIQPLWPQWEQHLW